MLVGQHHWPVWGRSESATDLSKQRDLYKYVHDHTLRMMNHGMTAPEIAEALVLPRSLANEWQNRDYYGSVRHNVKAIYQEYLAGTTPTPLILTRCHRSRGRRNMSSTWAGRMRFSLVRARISLPVNFAGSPRSAKSAGICRSQQRGCARLCADAFEQLGYLAEASTWRNSYLFGAHELRNGVATSKWNPVSGDMVSALSVGMFFDYLGVRLNGPKADGKRAVVNWTFTDTGRNYVLNLENSALTYVAGRLAPDADVSLTLARPALTKILQRQATFAEAIGAGEIKIVGNTCEATGIVWPVRRFESRFAIVEP